jgi:NitT/TauT family transport system substrate-binding protein
MDSHRERIERSQALSRRDFLRVAASVGAIGAGAVLLGGCGSGDGKSSSTSTPGIVADPPPETTTIRLAKHTPSSDPREAPLYLAEPFLLAEGFTDVRYVDVPQFAVDTFRKLASGEIDISMEYASTALAAADAGDKLVVLAGVYSNSFQLFGNERVQSLRDLKGKRIFVFSRDATESVYALWAVLLGYVGIDLEHDVEFVVLADPLSDLVPAIQAGTIDAWLSAGAYTTIFRTARIGHVFLDTLVDPPWSQYFGGMVAANRDFVEKHPAATKRALRAILKATDVCAREPERAARYLVDRGFTTWNYDVTLDAIDARTFAAWREFNPEDTMRFNALRLKDAGLVKSNPDELIARATDWRYLNEIKRELGVA